MLTNITATWLVANDCYKNVVFGMIINHFESFTITDNISVISIWLKMNSRRALVCMYIGDSTILLVQNGIFVV